MYGGVDKKDPSEIWSKPEFTVKQILNIHLAQRIDPLPDMEYRLNEYQDNLDKVGKLMETLTEQDLYDEFESEDEYERINKLTREIIQQKHTLGEVTDTLTNGLQTDETIRLKGNPWFFEIQDKIDVIIGNTMDQYFANFSHPISPSRTNSDLDSESMVNRLPDDPVNRQLFFSDMSNIEDEIRDNPVLEGIGPSGGSKKTKKRSKRKKRSKTKKLSKYKKVKDKSKKKKRKTHKGAGDFKKLGKELLLNPLKIGSEGLKIGVETAKLGQEGVKVGTEAVKFGQEAAKLGQEGLKATGKVTASVGDVAANSLRVVGSVSDRIASNQERKVQEKKMKQEEGLEWDKKTASLEAEMRNMKMLQKLENEKRKMDKKIRRRMKKDMKKGYLPSDNNYLEQQIEQSIEPSGGSKKKKSNKKIKIKDKV
jgi:hypothetical protein